MLEPKILIDCVTSLYKLNPWTTLKNLFPVLLDWSIPILFKVVVVKAFHSIVNEVTHKWRIIDLMI